VRRSDNFFGRNPSFTEGRGSSSIARKQIKKSREGGGNGGAAIRRKEDPAAQRRKGVAKNFNPQGISMNGGSGGEEEGTFAGHKKERVGFLPPKGENLGEAR